jgi:hypothetical protein
MGLQTEAKKKYLVVRTGHHILPGYNLGSYNQSGTSHTSQPKNSKGSDDGPYVSAGSGNSSTARSGSLFRVSDQSTIPWGLDPHLIHTGGMAFPV